MSLVSLAAKHAALQPGDATATDRSNTPTTTASEFAKQLAIATPATPKGPIEPTLDAAKPAAAEPTATKPAATKPVATKPAVKKPAVDPGAALATAPDATVLTAQPAASSVLQVVAALASGANAMTDAPAPAASSEQAIAIGAASASAAAAAQVPAQAARATQDEVVQQLVAIEAAPKQAAASQPPLTPLEQAVHDLLAELADKPETKHAAAPSGLGEIQAASATFAAPLLAPSDAVREAKPAAPIAPPQQPAELVSQSHAHLVFDDANGRVVMTVAVRGSEVNVSVRATDDATASALARNAATLDDAMRGRGLQLAQFDAQRDLAREQNPDRPTYQREDKRDANAERFTLEENP